MECLQSQLSFAAPAMVAGRGNHRDQSDLAHISGLEGHWLHHFFLASSDFRQYSHTYQAPICHVGVRDSVACGYILCSPTHKSLHKEAQMGSNMSCKTIFPPLLITLLLFETEVVALCLPSSEIIRVSKCCYSK